MIKKLDLHKRHSFGLLEWFAHWNEPSGAELLESKINELVDAVNDITDWIKRTDETIVKYGIKPIPENSTNSKMENVDPYAEQRKWIGKLCRVETGGEYGYGILKDVSASHPTHPFNVGGLFFRVCKPVSPDDDIIYKGE